MARIIRLTVDVLSDLGDVPNIEIRIHEQIRRSIGRDVLSIQCGQTVHAEDFELVNQLFEDVLSAAIHRTIGVQGQLL